MLLCQNPKTCSNDFRSHSREKLEMSWRLYWWKLEGLWGSINGDWEGGERDSKFPQLSCLIPLLASQSFLSDIFSCSVFSFPACEVHHLALCVDVTAYSSVHEGLLLCLLLANRGGKLTISHIVLVPILNPHSFCFHTQRNDLYSTDQEQTVWLSPAHLHSFPWRRSWLHGLVSWRKELNIDSLDTLFHAFLPGKTAVW